MKKQTFKTKQAARQAVWDQLVTEKLARFPLPPYGRIPNFAGAKDAAKRLFELPVFQQAKRMKVNPDAPQRYVRELALQKGITIFVPTPRLRGGFRRFDPRKGNQWSELVPLARLPQLDAIVTGSVAVTPKGHRCGKGEGYGDLEYAILHELGHAPIPVATTVHEVQLVKDFPHEHTDLPLTFIVTPERTIHVPPRRKASQGQGIDWNKLPPQALTEMPILEELQENLKVRVNRRLHRN